MGNYFCYCIKLLFLDLDIPIILDKLQYHNLIYMHATCVYFASTLKYDYIFN